MGLGVGGGGSWGLEVHGEVQGDLGSVETKEVVKYRRRRCQGRSPSGKWLGLGVGPFRLFSSRIGGV